jgi:small multidrug resistance family-3 protein
MLNLIQKIPVPFIVLIATVLEVFGDAIIRNSIYKHTGSVRAGLMIAGALLLFGYGSVLNLAPVEFGQVVGIYIATLFVVWQVISFITFGTLPSVPIVVGGSLIVAGGLIVTFWKN